VIRYIFFDVSGTLLYKPSLYSNIQVVLRDYGMNVSLEEIKYKHKLLSEIIHFPDRTDSEFYVKFNTELLRLFGLVPNKNLVEAVFNKCTYLPWEKYSDTEYLSKIELPMGVISNFNSTLPDKLNRFFGPIFKDIFVSEDLGVAKPKVEFYQRAIEAIDYLPSEILYIGDSLKLDVEPAEQLGLKCLLIDRDDFYSSSEHRIKDLSKIQKYTT
jgi:FMN phosphatase YigB (HAD superfamily)